MVFVFFFGFLGVPEHDQKTSFFLDWLRTISGGLRTQFDASGDPQNRSRERHFEYLWGAFWGTRFLTVFSSLFCFVFDSVDLEFVSLFIVFQALFHFSKLSKNARKNASKTYEKSMENRWKNPPKTVTPTGHQKKHRFPLCFRSRVRSRTISGISGGR